MSDEEEDPHHFLHPPPQPPPPPSSMRHLPTSDINCGEIVEVQGGHIVRSTGRKDRHSKVCTAKGPRDRRVRLSAHTAIQFYDVQDRLGFDRPSKAVDWLIKKAKTSIDELAQLPPWNPADAIRNAAANAKPRRTTVKTQISAASSSPPPQNLHFGGFDGGADNNNESRFLPPPSLDSDSMKSFFPVEAPSHQLYHPPDLLSRTNSQNQDLRLSLLHHSASGSVPEPGLFYGQSNTLGYDASTVGWEQQSSEFGRIQRLVAWNNSSGGNDANGGFLFNPQTTSFQSVLGQSQQQQLHSQRGPLQSSYTPMIRAWFDPHQHHSTDDLNHNHITQLVHQSAIPGIGFASGEFSSGFRIPARFQGQEEEQNDGLNNKPSSASSISRH